MSNVCKDCGKVQKLNIGRDIDNAKKAYKLIDSIIGEMTKYSSMVDKIDTAEIRDAFKESLDKTGDAFYRDLKRSKTMLQGVIRTFEHVARDMYSH